MVMSTSDMSIQLNSHGMDSSTVEKSFPESSVQNPTTNTILRSLILPRVAIATNCQWTDFTIASDSVIFGIPQKPWMKSLIPEALPESSVRIDLLNNDTSEAKKHLPMGASVAADLLLAGYSARGAFAPVPVNTTFNPSRRPDYLSSSTTIEYALATRLVGLLPNDLSSTEAQQREWFISRSVGFVRKATSREWQNASLARWTMTLSRVNITSSVWVDAITVESEVDRSDEPHYQINGSRYYAIGDYRTFLPDSRYPDAKMDAFAVCNDSGIDKITSRFFPGEGNYSDKYCVNTSTTAMYVFSSGRRLKADAVYNDALAETVCNSLYNLSPNVYNSSSFPKLKIVKDLRYVYSTTYARINWQLQNLSEIYGTACRDEGGCMGLDANLTSNQRLLY